MNEQQKQITIRYALITLTIIFSSIILMFELTSKSKFFEFTLGMLNEYGTLIIPTLIAFYLSAFYHAKKGSNNVLDQVEEIEVMAIGVGMTTFIHGILFGTTLNFIYNILNFENIWDATGMLIAPFILLFLFGCMPALIISIIFSYILVRKLKKFG